MEVGVEGGRGLYVMWTLRLSFHMGRVLWLTYQVPVKKVVGGGAFVG